MSCLFHRAIPTRVLRLPSALSVCVLACALGAQTGSSKQAQDFLTARASASQTSSASSLQHAHAEHAAMLTRTRATSFTAAWQPLGPATVASPIFGNLSGRINAIALDPNDTTGNTVYLGTSGGGVWKSTSAAGPLAAASFAPLTDTLPVFAPGAGVSVIPSLAIGAVAVQPVANPIVLAGTGDDATGALYGEGILRSTDGGLTWTLAATSRDGANGNHTFAGLASSALAWSTASPSLVVAGFSASSQAINVGATTTSSVPGVYYSTDAGVTWHMSTLYDGATVVQQPQPLGTTQPGNSVTSVVWNAARGRFFAAVRAHGYYSSADGITWTRLAAQPAAALTTANCPVGLNGAGSAGCPIFRGALAVQPATGDIYALTLDAAGTDQGLWQDLCNITSSGTCSNAAPAFATRLELGAFAAVGQDASTLALSAAPAANNSTLLFAATADLYRCSLAAGATSCTFRNTTNVANGCPSAGVAPAQHAIATLAQTSGTPLLFVASGGGLWRSLDGVAQTPACSNADVSHFDNLNPAIASGGSLAEVTGFAQHPTDAGTLLASIASAGTAATAGATSSTAWPQLTSAEGSAPLLDAGTPSNWYVSIAAGVDLKLCANGTACAAADFTAPATIGAIQVANDASLAAPPALLDPAATTTLVLGTCRIWRGPASSGALWPASNTLSSPFGGGNACASTSTPIRSLAAGGPSTTSSNAAHNGSQVIYAGLAGLLDGGGSLAGHLFVTTAANTANGSTGWTDISLNPVTNASGSAFNPEAFDISSIFIDPHDPTGAAVYVTVMGFGVPHLYRSLDFGGHWLNLSANLPDAPANSVVVDPNDANTVYVALDTGVYATQTANTCATSNCWSILGVALPNAPVTQLQAAAQLLTGDGRRGMLRASTYGRGIWQTPLLSAIGVAAPGLTVSANSLTYAAQQVATQSTAQTITLTSSGSAPVTITSLALTGDFFSTDNCSGQTLTIGGSCSVQVRFAPTSIGSRTGLLTVYANIPGGQVTIALSGIGTTPVDITLTPGALTFAPTVVNQTAAAQIISVANTGPTGATLQTPALSGDFTLASSTCGATLAPQTECSLSIAFTPTASGTRSGTLTLTDSVGTQTAQLSGIGEAPATDTLSTATLSFAKQAVGSTSAAQLVTLTNAGDAPLTLITASVSGSGFAVVNNCGASLAAHATCAFSVSFVPAATGTLSATLTVGDQFRSQTVALVGIGAAPPGVSLTPTSLSFSATGVGLSAAAQTLTLTNNGGLPLTLTHQSIGADFTVLSSNCGTTLSVGAACTFTVIFTPSAAGQRSGTFVLIDNAPSGSQTVDLTGTGVDFALAANGATSVTVASGTSATFPLLLNSLSGLTGNVAFACTGAPAHSLCTVNPTTAALGSSVPVSATVQTGLSTVLLRPLDVPRSPNNPWPYTGTVILGCMLPLTRKRGRRIRASLLLAIVALTLAGLSGCGNGRLIPGSGSGPAQSAPTPAGTYTLTITGTAAGVSHSAPVTLIIQ